MDPAAPPAPTPVAPPPSPEPPPPDASQAEHRRHRPRGKIARLPPPIRARLNHLIDEGLTYREVLDQLGPDAAHITELDMTRWYKSGFQEWIRNQLWLENTRTRLDMAIDVIAENEGSDVHQANLHVAATQLIHDLI